MAYFENPMLAAEPFEESWQGSETKRVLASPDDLKAFYKDMEHKEKQERQEMLERKLSKRKSHSIWSRKSVKRSAPAQSEHQPSQQPPPRSATTLAPNSRSEKSKDGDDDAREMEKLEQNEKSDLISGLPSPRSIIPDPLRELPAWYTKEDWSTSSSFRTRYPIHNPVGPRYYKNYHLVPPSQYKSAARPPSVFSPSFPPMASSSMQERSEDCTRMPGPSRTPSNSPLPTPSSSQTRVADLGVKPRSRKTSQTAHDTVDLLDVSDPWGTNWHHQSPYDVGLGNGTAADGEANPLLRSRRSSMTTRETRRRTITPSPLSQSTSAIHLQATEGAYLNRKLTKRRTPLFGGLFGSGSRKPEPTSLSLPTSPLGDLASHSPVSLADASHRAATSSAVGPPSSFKVSTSKKERRGSILGRLTRRFSVARRPPPSSQGHEQEFNEDKEEDMVSKRQPGRQSSPEKLKRVAPPSMDDAESLTGLTPPEADRRSSVSVEAPFSTIGKLMVANPDAPSSETSTPPPVEAPLPVHRQAQDDSQSPIYPSSSSSPPPSQSAATRSSEGEALQESLHKSPVPSSLSPPLSTHSSNTIVPSGGTAGNNEVVNSSSQRRSIDDKVLPKISNHTSSASTSLNDMRYRSSETKRPRSPEYGPPPPSSTTKPIPLPNVSVGPPPPSSTTKPIPLPSTSGAPPPPSATTKPIALPVSATSFPAAQAGPVYPFPVHLSAPTAENIVDSSPLSAASMLVNPPTPRSVDNAPMTEAPLISTRTSSREGKRSSRDPSPGISSVTARETETFKLVRSKSGHVYASSDSFIAAGEQWEVEQVVPQQQNKESKGKEKERSSSSRSKDKERELKERESRRDSRRQEKTRAEADTETDQRTKRSSRSQRQHSVDDIPGTSYSTQPVKRSISSESPIRQPIPEYMRQHDEARTGRSQEVRDRRSSRKTAQSASPIKAQTSTPDPAPGAPLARPLERNPSTSIRPTSEVPTSADLNALRAREAWEMERLYKARSMYGMESDGAPPPPLGIPSTSSNSDGAEVTKSKVGSIHGSSHTSFMMQNPLEFYHSMPAAPPPIIYASTSLPNQSTAGLPPSQTSFSSPEVYSLVSRTPNPLPEPPRESAYDTSRLSQALSDNNRRPAEYWTKYAEVTTVAH